MMPTFGILAAVAVLLIAGLGLLFLRRAGFLLQVLRERKRLLATLQGFEYLGPAGTRLQRHPRSCGPAAMEIVFKHNGVDVSLESLEGQMMDQPGGTSMRRMKAVAETHGFPARARRVTLAELPRIPLPSIALFKRKHYIVVEAHAPDDALIIIDPCIGRCRVPAAKFLRDCDGELLMIWNHPRRTPTRTPLQPVAE